MRSRPLWLCSGAWNLRASLLLWLMILAIPHAASARPRDSEVPDLRRPPGKAQKLIAAAERALAGSDRTRARAKLRAALRVWPAPPLLWRIGELLHTDGDIVRAQDFFRRALGDGSESLTAPQREEAERVLGLPHPPAGDLLIIGPRGAEVLVQSEPVARLPLLTPLLLPAGSQDVTVRSGRRSLSGSAGIRAGRRLTLRFDLSSGAVLSTWSPTVILLVEGPALAPVRRDALEAAGVRAIAGHQFEVLPRDTALLAAPSLVHCLDRLTCQADLAIQNGVDYAVVLRMEEAAPTGFNVAARLVDARMGDVATEVTRSCPGCASAEAEAALSAAIAQVFTGMRRARGLLEVTSVPPGARVLLDGRQVGITPHRRTAWAGKGHLTLMRDGFVPHQQDLDIPEGRTLSLEIALQPQVRLAPATAQGK